VSGALVGRFTDTRRGGSYNVVVTARGHAPVCNTRFVRKELVSIVVN
jgi:hypothetical protein